jgi:hypothetical protein
MTRRLGVASFAVALLLICLSGTAAAQSYKVEKTTAPVPEEAAAPVRETLAGEALRVTGPNGIVCELWLRKAVPGKRAPAQELGVVYGQLAEGTLVGVIRFPSEVKDYRRQRVKAGVYTLRYAIIPVDGNHQGVAPQRDFVIAAPASADKSPATVTRDATIDLGRKTTGTNHPSVWSLAAVESGSDNPAVKHVEDGDLWVLHFRAQLAPESGGATTALPMALVVVGAAPEA